MVMMMMMVVLITNDNNGNVMIAFIGGDIDGEDHQENSNTNANLKDVVNILSIWFPQIHFHSGSLFPNIKNAVCSNPGILFAANQARQPACLVKHFDPRSLWTCISNTYLSGPS